MNRRKFLSIFTSTVVALTSGCSNIGVNNSESPTSPKSPPFDTPDPLDCTAARESGAHLPHPTPTSSLEPKSYPDIPEIIDENRAKDFVRNFETAFRHNSILIRYDDDKIIKKLSVKSEVPKVRPSKSNDGFIVSIEGQTTVRYSSSTEGSDQSSTPHTSTQDFATWYYLTNRFAIRQADSDGDIQRDSTPELDAARIVVCGEQTE